MLRIMEGNGDLQFISITPCYDNTEYRYECDETLIEESIRKSYKDFVCYIESHQAVLLYERIYASGEYLNMILDLRNDVLHPCSSKVFPDPTCIVTHPLSGKGFAGIQAAVLTASAGNYLKTVVKDNLIYGMVCEGREAQYFCLNDLSRRITTPAVNPSSETNETLRFANTILEEYGWRYRDVCRTWFYLKDILSWYPEFNQTRNSFYSEVGILNGHKNSILPASTGIMGNNSRNGWCTLDLFAVQPVPGKFLEIKRLNNTGQKEAPEYGSAFSRGISVTTSSSQYVFVSGTASIDEKGNSIHVDDFENQVYETVKKIQTLLQPINCSLHSITQGTVFIKRKQDIECFKRLAVQLGFDQLPLVYVLADVCRPDLLFEIDAIAYQPVNMELNDIE